MSTPTRKTCSCGKAATETFLTQGGEGLVLSHTCSLCAMHIREHAEKIVRILRCSWFAMPPTLRPKDLAHEDFDQHLRKK